MNNILRLRHLPLHNLKRIVEPTEEPLGLDEVKAHLRLRHNSEDDYVRDLIVTAREMAEEDTKRALMTQTWRLMMDQVPTLGLEEWWDGVRDGAEIAGLASTVELPRPPLQSLTHIKTYNAADEATVFAATNYYVDTSSDPGRVALRAAAVWPYADRATNGIELQWVAGYASAALVPRPIKHAMLLLIGVLYQNRETRGMPYDAAKMWTDYVVRL